MFSLFGDSDLVARLLPALFGLLLIPLVYCIYRLGYINKNQTLVAALFHCDIPGYGIFLPLPPP